MKGGRSPGKRFFLPHARFGWEQRGLQKSHHEAHAGLVPLQRKFLAQVPLAHLGVGRKLFRGAVL